MDKPSFLRRLDYLPPAAAGALGVALGAGTAAALLLGLQPVAAAVVFVALLALAGALAWSGEPVAVPERTVAEPELSVELISIPAGSFRMGSPDDEEGRLENEGPVHEVRVSAFQCMRYPVTRRLHAEVTGKDTGRPEGAADNRPVNNVTWYDAVRFCNRLSERDGLAPCYQLDGDEVSWDRSADGYRLPTEAEWEYACRAGAQTRWSFGDDEEQLEEHAWYHKSSGGEPRAVGLKKPNAWGLHDMHGNVLEWCWDWHGPYSRDSQEDPSGPSEGGARVLRGGSFANPARGLRSAGRGWIGPENSFRFIGFRCVRVPRRQP